MGKKLTVVLILAFIVTAIVGCSHGGNAGTHGSNGGIHGGDGGTHGGNEGHMIEENNNNQGANFKGSKNEFSGEVLVNASLEEVFPLLGPTRENDWVPGWESFTTLIWSESGFAEDNAVFQTAPGGAKDVWIISQYEPMEKIVFVRFNPNVVTRLIIDLAEEQDKTRLTWTQSQVGLSENGNSIVEAENEESYSIFMKSMDAMLNYYVQRGEMIDQETLNEHLDAPSH